MNLLVDDIIKNYSINSHHLVIRIRSYLLIINESYRSLFEILNEIKFVLIVILTLDDDLSKRNLLHVSQSFWIIERRFTKTNIQKDMRSSNCKMRFETDGRRMDQKREITLSPFSSHRIILMMHWFIFKTRDECCFLYRPNFVNTIHSFPQLVVSDSVTAHRRRE